MAVYNLGAVSCWDIISAQQLFIPFFERLSMSRIIPVLLAITVTVALSLGLSGCGCNDSRCSFTNIPSGQP